MTKIKASHNVNTDVARFGTTDPEEVCNLVAQSIPADVLKNAKRILDVGIGCGGIARAIVKRLVEELYVDWDDAILRVYGVDNNLALVNKARRNGFVHTVCADFQSWDPEMQFDVIVGNPPYSDRSGLSSKSKDLDDKFTLIAADMGEFFSLIIRSKHFTNPRSSFRKKLFGSGKLVAISYLSSDFFPTIQNTETCIVTWSNTHSGSTRIKYKDGSVEERTLTSTSLLKLNNPNFVGEVDNNLSHRWVRGKLYRGQFEVGECPIVEICGTGESPVVSHIRQGQEDIGRNSWGVVVNVNAEWGALGRVMLKPFDASISASIVCLKTDTEEEAIVLREYLLSEKIKDIIRVNMPSFHPTKDLFRKIPDPLKVR